MTEENGFSPIFFLSSFQLWLETKKQPKLVKLSAPKLLTLDYLTSAHRRVSMLHTHGRAGKSKKRKISSQRGREEGKF
jgi:hypothetical protein